jgi:hypothetical protein
MPHYTTARTPDYILRKYCLTCKNEHSWHSPHYRKCRAIALLLLIKYLQIPVVIYIPHCSWDFRFRMAIEITPFLSSHSLQLHRRGSHRFDGYDVDYRIRYFDTQFVLYILKVNDDRFSRWHWYDYGIPPPPGFSEASLLLLLAPPPISIFRTPRATRHR